MNGDNNIILRSMNEVAKDWGLPDYATLKSQGRPDLEHFFVKVCEKLLLNERTIANQQLEELKEQVDLQHEMARADQAKIAFLKEALSFSLQFIPRSTINVNRIAKIENLLK